MTLRSLSDTAFGDFYSVSDLNGVQTFVQSGSFSAAGGRDVRWQALVRPDHGLLLWKTFYPSEDLELDLTNTIFALDSTTIDLCPYNLF